MSPLLSLSIFFKFSKTSDVVGEVSLYPQNKNGNSDKHKMSSLLISLASKALHA